MASWVDTIVVGAIIIFGLFYFYKALKEPLDLLFGGIGRGIKSGMEKLSGAGESGYDTITYG